MGLALSEQIEAASDLVLIVSDSVSHQPLTFGHVFKEALANKGLSQEAFARASGAVGPHVNLICNGKRTPPIDRLDAWADVLGLKGRDRRRFLDLGALAHLPAEVRGRFLAIYEEHQELLDLRDRILEAERNAKK